MSDDRNFPSPEEIRDFLAAGRRVDLHRRLATFHPADIADLLDRLPPKEAVAVFDLLSIDIGSEVLDETSTQIRQELVEHFEEDRLADLLDELPVDDAAAFLADLPDPVSARLLKLMEPKKARKVRQLLYYEDESAGRLMNTEVAALKSEWTVAEALDFLRSLEKVETLHYLYVVDTQKVLIGVVPLRTLILAPPEKKISEIMKGGVVSVEASADQEKIGQYMARYDFFALPVVNKQGRLLGVITVDDVLDVLENEATEDMQRLGGSEPLENAYFASSIPQMVGKRIVWLLPLFLASMVTDTVIQGFESLLQSLVTLTIFIPVVIGTGGNAGSQTVATIIRAIAVGEIRLADFSRAFFREAAVGILLGLFLGAAAYFRASLFGADPLVSLVLALTLPLVILVANSLATIVPLVAEHLKIDPAVVSAPMITTMVDASGLLIYF